MHEISPFLDKRRRYCYDEKRRKNVVVGATDCEAI